MILKGYKWTVEGFTVLEVLMVLLIVGMLDVIAIPRIVSSSDAAKRNICKNNIDVINSQIELYYATIRRLAE